MMQLKHTSTKAAVYHFCHVMLCISVAYAVMWCPSVRLFVRPSRLYILSKRLKISLKFFHHRVAPPFLFFHTKWHGNIPTGTPLTGASNAVWVGRNLDSQRISGFVIDNCCTLVCILHLATGFLFTAGIGRPSETALYTGCP